MLLEPCKTCAGFGHVCKDEDPAGHIHDHTPALPLCKVCGGRGMVEVKPTPAPAVDDGPEEA